MSMTNEEAVERVKTMRWEHATNPSNPDHEAMTMAIEALKKEPCEDCISRAEVKRIVDFYASQIDGIFRVNESIDNLPPVLPKREQGEWIKDDFTGLIKCSRCKNDAPISTVSGTQYESDFCQSCGAEMR